MTWLIRLYPSAWRRRYGEELAELLATQPASLRTAIDLVAGAVDAWLNPQSSTAAVAADSKGQGTMMTRMLKLTAAGCGAKPTRADAIKGAAVTIGGSLVLMLAFMWAKARYGKNPYLESLALVLWMVPMLFGFSYTEMKGRSGGVKAVFIGGFSAFVIIVGLAAAWLNNN